jgi:hypothetical protein
MMRKPHGARLTSHARLLLSWVIRLLVRHVSNRPDEVDGVIAFAADPRRGHRLRAAPLV